MKLIYYFTYNIAACHTGDCHTLSSCIHIYIFFVYSRIICNNEIHYKWQVSVNIEVAIYFGLIKMGTVPEKEEEASRLMFPKTKGKQKQK